MGWFKPSGADGPGHVHPFASYNSSDPAVVDAQLDEIKGSGGDGVIFCWNGMAMQGVNSLVHKAMHAVLKGCESKGLKFLPALDIAAYTYRDDKSLSSQQVLEMNLSYACWNLYSSPIAEPYLLQFNFESQQVDWSALAAKFPEVKICHRHVAGLDKPASGGGFTWADAGPSYHADQMVQLLKWQRVNPNSDKAFFVGLLSQFDNRKRDSSGVAVSPQQAVWTNTAVKIIDGEGGRTYAGYVQRTRDAVASGAKIDATFDLTGNDWEEGTAQMRVRP